jgi:hypothetical protein
MFRSGLTRCVQRTAGYMDERAAADHNRRPDGDAHDMTLKIDLILHPVAKGYTPPQCCELDPGRVPRAQASSDADGSIVSYAWDFDNNGTLDYTSATPTTTHALRAGGAQGKAPGHGQRRRDRTRASQRSPWLKPIRCSCRPPAMTPIRETRALPKLTITAGIAALSWTRSVCCPATVVVAGIHTESPTFVPDMRVRGGYGRHHVDALARQLLHRERANDARTCRRHQRCKGARAHHRFRFPRCQRSDIGRRHSAQLDRDARRVEQRPHLRRLSIPRSEWSRRTERCRRRDRHEWSHSDESKRSGGRIAERVCGWQ